MENSTERASVFDLLSEMGRNRDIDGWNGRARSRCVGGMSLFTPLTDFAKFQHNSVFGLHGVVVQLRVGV
jgi:hypothetical protein